MRLAALLTAAMGVVNVLSAITPAVAERLRVLEQYSPLEVRQGGHLTAALAGFALLLLATSLWRRKRVAWLLTLLVLLASVVAHLVKGLDYEEATLAVLVSLPLVLWRSEFHARSDPPSVRQAFVTLLAAIGFTLAYGTLGFYLLDRHFRVTFGFWEAVRQTVVMFTQYYDPGLQPTTGFGRYFADSIYAVALATTGYALLLLVRPVLAPKQASEGDRTRAMDIVQQYGRTSLAPFALLDDKLYYFSAGGSLVDYVVKGRVALALGDPIGPRRDASLAITGFRSLCARNDWIPAFYQTLPDLLKAYRAAGFQSIQIGQEAIVSVEGFSLEGGERKSIRTSVNKMKRLGYLAQIVEPPHPDGLIGELDEVSDEWLSERETSEMRFSVGWFDRGYLNRCPLLIVRSPTGRAEAFASILRGWPASEVGVDMMRQRTGSEAGLMDFLFASLLDWAKSKGYASFSFGLSGLSGIGEHPGDPAIERALRFAYLHLNQLYSFKGLHTYKAKFGPIWAPRYLTFPDWGALPAVAAAVIRANTGDEFLTGYLFRPK